MIINKNFVLIIISFFFLGNCKNPKNNAKMRKNKVSITKSFYGKTKDKKYLKKIELPSGSVVIMQEKSRLMYHSIAKILQVKDNLAYKTCSKFFPRESRVNITLRRYSPK